MTTTQPDAARLARRYPTRTLSTRVIVVIGLVATVVGLVWLGWTSLFWANPAITARVSSFAVQDDGTATATVTVQRNSPDVSGRCTLIAQAVTFERVGEVIVQVPEGGEPLTEHEITVKTLKRATSLSIEGCLAG